MQQAEVKKIKRAIINTLITYGYYTLKEGRMTCKAQYERRNKMKHFYTIYSKALRFIQDIKGEKSDDYSWVLYKKNCDEVWSDALHFEKLEFVKQINAQRKSELEKAIFLRKSVKGENDEFYQMALEDYLRIFEVWDINEEKQSYFVDIQQFTQYWENSIIIRVRKMTENGKNSSNLPAEKYSRPFNMMKIVYRNLVPANYNTWSGEKQIEQDRAWIRLFKSRWVSKILSFEDNNYLDQALVYTLALKIVMGGWAQYQHYELYRNEFYSWSGPQVQL